MVVFGLEIGLRNSEKFDHFQTSFSLKSALSLNIHFCDLCPVACVSSDTGPIHFRSCGTFRDYSLPNRCDHSASSAVVCHLVNCRIGVKSAPRYIRYISRIWLLTQISVPSTEGVCQQWYRSPIEDTFGVAVQMSSTDLCTKLKMYID